MNLPTNTSLLLGSYEHSPLMGWDTYIPWIICAIAMLFWFGWIAMEYISENQSNDFFDFLGGEKRHVYPVTSPLLKGIYLVVSFIPRLFNEPWPLSFMAMLLNIIILLALSPAILITLIVDAIPWWRLSTKVRRWK